MEKKIKNINKSIMIIVAVLLTLVLISTSTVSGIFAKYVVTKDATTIVSLKKFGVKLTMLQGEHFDDAGASADDELNEDNDTISVTLSNIQLVPGSDFPEIIKFVAEDADTSDSSPFTVDTRIKVKAVVNTTSTDEFHYENTTFIPITSKVKVNSTEASISDAGVYSDIPTYQTNLTNGLRNAIGTDVESGDGEWAGAKIATAGNKVFDSNAKTTIAFGFACPDTYGGSDSEKFDKIMTQIAENEAKLSITFYVSLEQIV